MADRPVPMHSAERLEISFLSQPLSISASLITPGGEGVIQNSFEGFNCPAEWVAALKAMAAATKSARLTAPPSPIASSPSSSGHNVADLVTHRLVKPNPRKRARVAAPAEVHSDTTTRSPVQSASNVASASLIQSPDPLRESASDLPLLDTIPLEQPQTSVPANGAERLQVTSPLADDAPAAPTSSASLNTQQRTQRLEARLQAISSAPIPNKDDFNDTIRRLYIEPFSASPQAVGSKEQFANVLGRLGNIASVQGIIYSLLSWLIFLWEEDRLVHDEGQALPVAAKRVNDMMAEVSNRRARTKDWASDGRKAARMVFDSIADLSTAAQSFALLVLAGNVTLDGLLKVAHFPTLREYFRARFTKIVEERYKGWEALVEDGYLVFDFKEFLGTSGTVKGRPRAPTLPNAEDASERSPLEQPVQSSFPSPNPSHLLFTDLYTTSTDQGSHEAESQPTVELAGMLGMDPQHPFFEELPQFGLFESGNNLHEDMDFQLWPTESFQDIPTFAA